MKQLICLGLALLCATSTLLAQNNRDKRNLTYTDPATAAAEDPDFNIQGEYGVNKVGADWGVQVVALGDGKFDAYLLEGGLPGLGHQRDKLRLRLTGGREGDIVKLASEDGKLSAEIRDQKIIVKKDGKQIAELSRIKRESPTRGAKAPAGALVLFDGGSADQWNKGKVVNGLLANSDCTTKEKFQDYTLHLEFRTPYKPYARGQGRGNSGVYHQARFETQVLDSFGLVGLDNECGGIYTIAKPKVNMCYPPLRWQTYDVEFTAAKYDSAGNKTANARITVRHNGVLIHDDQELSHSTTASPMKEGPEPGPIYLQSHGNPVFYRNIWIVKK